MFLHLNTHTLLIPALVTLSWQCCLGLLLTFGGVPIFGPLPSESRYFPWRILVKFCWADWVRFCLTQTIWWNHIKKGRQPGDSCTKLVFKKRRYRGLTKVTDWTRHHTEPQKTHSTSIISVILFRVTDVHHSDTFAQKTQHCREFCIDTHADKQ